MHRRSLLDLLDRYERRHPGERTCVLRIRTLVEGHPDCFERTCRPGHVTASAWIVSHDRSRFLLTHHRKLGRWLQLGGHTDGDGDVPAAALREAREESGLPELAFARNGGGVEALDLDVHRIPAIGDESAHEHHDVRFLLVSGPDERLVMSGESVDLRWFDRAEAGAVATEESLARLARKAEAWLRKTADEEGP